MRTLLVPWYLVRLLVVRRRLRRLRRELAVNDEFNRMAADVAAAYDLPLEEAVASLRAALVIGAVLERRP